MKKKYRLLKRPDFEKTLKRGTKVSSSNFICYYLKDLSSLNIRIGIIIPKKKCKSSPNRKYLKRLFWAFSREENLNFFPKVKCVFFYRSEFLQNFSKKRVNFEEMRLDFLSVALRIENRVNK
ncbi:ribonuclease P protein component [Mycoplasma haemofelis str. Langford 1]|uniref:Ribonuclease P protein component n=1 Tax=Mycoplasma haemofelis (strain Langford 1) TaxID=941640 RepID=E8ZK81_MYCHL|nr:ribonuclease P protein component [Mycoplasma haemofelis]CBY93552.1 ribonuclease P protein component [Mycoplasma haemofelis str. Langford 1]